MKLVITSVRPRTRLLEQGREVEAPNKHLALLRSIIIVTIVNIFIIVTLVNIFIIVTLVNIVVISSIITSSNMAVTIPLKTELLGLFLL